MTDDIVSLLTRRGVLSGGELQRALRISAATLSRQVRGAERILRIGRTRGARYAAYRRVAGLPSRLPIFRVDAEGDVQLVANLHLLSLGQHWLEPMTATSTLFAGLPLIIADMAPQGFLGRRFAEIHADLALPRRLQDWNDDHRLIATARRGEDCIGNLIVGEESLHRFLDNAATSVKRQDYPALARIAAERGAGSSAGGEQPKFTAWREARHLIVKFTAGDGSAADQRWRDLLVCEWLATEILNENGISAAQAEIVDVGPQRFLEVERFDRIGERGRRGVLTAGPLDDELYGQRDNWPAFAERMTRDRLLAPEQIRRIRLLEAFGQLIGNSDRHFGNLSFFADGLSHMPTLQLAPVYDMVPMAWAPYNGIVPALDLPAARPRANILDVWQAALRLAQLFWRRVATDDRISRELRTVAVEAATLLDRG
ncbi:MAG TPA: type II toxin-antitoxin system HipA family toxin YjjJ [Gammaproteobacteria bacterium]|nr:type II toxin-antitoxin system HipA family toxin YjjJ [Gammaproteobacteria bacterium]